MVSIDRKLEGLGLKQQEVEKKIEDLEITTDSPDAIITENTAALKNAINSLENNLKGQVLEATGKLLQGQLQDRFWYNFP